MCISVQQLCYIHADKEPLFRDISLMVNKGEQVSLVGNNGSGKSTLLRIMEGSLKPSSGEVVCSSKPYYVPQHFGQYDELTVVQALQVEAKIKALHAIISGDASVENFTILDDDWNIEERSVAALSFWGLEHIRLEQTMNTLSGGEKTKVYLSGIQIHSPEIILMDEPTNHLDICHQLFLMEYLRQCKRTVLIVLHDLRLASHYCQKVCLMKDGRILEAGDPLNVLNSARTREVFGIEGEAHMTANGERDFRLFDGSAPLIRR